MSEKRIFLFVMLGFGISMALLGIYLAIEPVATTEARQQVATNLQSTPTGGRSITVPSRTMWYDTGIDVPANASVRIDYKSGRWTYERNGAYVDGQGVQFNRRELIVSGSNLSSLVGKVGNSTFTVGNSYNGRPGSGRLYLSINDVPGTYNDNDGQLEVYVSVNR